MKKKQHYAYYMSMREIDIQHVFNGGPFSIRSVESADRLATKGILYTVFHSRDLSRHIQSNFRFFSIPYNELTNQVE